MVAVRGPRLPGRRPARATGRCWSCGPTRWPRSCRRRSAPSWSPPGGSRPRCSAETRDGNLVGVGDLIQARRNDYTLRVHGGRPVTNREIYEVIGRNRLTGTLTVRDRDGILAHLPAAYVQQHTTLAYAVTSYGAQGQTVYSSHSLVDQRHHPRRGVRAGQPRHATPTPSTSICQHAPDHHDPERIDRTPVAVLTDILTRPVDRNTAAEIARRAGADETRSLAWVGTQWDLLTAEYGRHRATDTLTRLLPADVAARLVDEPGYGRLMGAVRSHGAGRARPARGARRGRRPRQPARRELRLRRAALPHPAARQRRPHPRTRGARRGLDHLRRTVGRPGRRLRPGARRGRDRPADRAR